MVRALTQGVLSDLVLHRVKIVKLFTKSVTKATIEHPTMAARLVVGGTTSLQFKFIAGSKWMSFFSWLISIWFAL